MKPVPTETIAVMGATVEFEVQFSRKPKGRATAPAAAPPPRRSAPVRPSVVTMTPPSATRLVSASPPVAATPAAAPALDARAAPLPATVVVLEAPPRTVQPALLPRVPKIALLLVLGHHFERLVRDGVVKDYAEIARRTGLTRARVTQICNLTLLAPEIQEEILSATGNERAVIERRLRDLVAISEWPRQRDTRHLISDCVDRDHWDRPSPPWGSPPHRRSNSGSGTPELFEKPSWR